MCLSYPNSKIVCSGIRRKKYIAKKGRKQELRRMCGKIGMIVTYKAFYQNTKFSHKFLFHVYN